MTDDPDRLPSWVTWEQRPFPDANLLFLPGRNPVLVDSGFVGHAERTADWVHARIARRTVPARLAVGLALLRQPGAN